MASAAEIVLRELRAVTADTWSDADYEDAPERRQLVADVAAGVFSDDVLEEMTDCLDRDWCAEVPVVRRAFWAVLARHGELERFDSRTIYSRRPRTTVVDGERYIVG